MTLLTETWLQMKKRHREERAALVAAALTETNGNKLAASKLIEMPEPSLSRVVREWGLDKHD